ncbi:MAG: ABC transporter ATP-binding protein [Phycisphaerales bacterium]|jgi:phospholipid/cholesterol/gamma-HCH transport system ATP-binding protein
MPAAASPPSAPAPARATEPRKVAIALRGVSIGYGERAIVEGIDLDILTGEILFIGGGSGCGKTTLLSSLNTLRPPLSGSIVIDGIEIAGADEDTLQQVRRRFGMMYQLGALFGGMTLLENVRLPLEEFTTLPREAMDDLARAKLGLVGLAAHADKKPAEISGGMQKRAAIARALALDPPIIFLDEPSAGLDPVTSADLDALIVALNRMLGTTFVVISHELASIYAIGHRFAMLDGARRRMVALGPPAELRDHSDDPWVRRFLTRTASGDHG